MVIQPDVTLTQRSTRRQVESVVVYVMIVNTTQWVITVKSVNHSSTMTQTCQSPTLTSAEVISHFSALLLLLHAAW